MSKFGWSYPPGCSGTPFDEEYPCELCGREEDSCICPECGICESQGDPRCYDNEGHGLEETQAQAQYRKIGEILMMIVME
jgi:hypothetical protein